ncbi:MAG: hypothetical protein JW829_16960 [Pirellulales bacterium]|nr:hypothetical protein [Pirellulales bacterium]
MRLSTIPCALACPAVFLTMLAVRSTGAGDLSTIPLIDGERAGDLNYWGGPFGIGNISSIAKQSVVVHSGQYAYRVDLGSIGSGGFGFFQTFSSGFGPSAAYRQTRNLDYFDLVGGYIRNETGTDFTLKFEIKDYRDSGSHQAFRRFEIPASGDWTNIEASLDLNASGWTVVGSPDLSRTFAISFIVEATHGPVDGLIYMDDIQLFEHGSLDIQTAPIREIATRIAHRQLDGLWSSRSRTHGLIPNTSHEVMKSAMNTTAGVLWLLPSAIRRGWVSQADADAYAGQLAATLNANLNQTTYLPSRFADLATAGPVANAEESTIDAAFLALALHQYKSLPTTSDALRQAIDDVQNRFQWDAFSEAGRFHMAYFPASGITPYSYDGYTNEGKVISLAAAVSEDHHIPIEANWNADTLRVRAHLADPGNSHLVHSSNQFRAPFSQALLNLFVDTSTRGVDNFPVRTLATNPWQNFVRYERDVAARLDQLGRNHLFQPDAGQGPQSYRQYSLYNNFDQPNLFMPWSVALALLAGADGAENALRTLLDSGLHGPLGPADSAQWATDATGPTDVPAYQDNWNLVLSTMALMEYLDGQNSASRFFASLSEVDASLDRVFLPSDFNGDGVVDGADFLVWQTGFGITAGATPAEGDADGDADVDRDDLSLWQRHFGDSLSNSDGVAAVPESPSVLLWLLVMIGQWSLVSGWHAERIGRTSLSLRRAKAVSLFFTLFT